MRRFEAVLLVADAEKTYVITGNGDVLKPEHGVAAIGGGGSNYAQAAALALLQNTDLDAQTMVKKALAIAGDLCTYTNHSTTIEVIDSPVPNPQA